MTLGLSLAEVARRANTSVPTLSRYENGWSRFEIGTLRKLATALDAELCVHFEPRNATCGEGTKRSQAVTQLARLFWDHPLSAADLDKHTVWVVERVLAYGQLKDVRMISGLLGADSFLDAVAMARFSSSKTRTFWEQILAMEGRSCTRAFSRDTAWTS